MLLRRLARLCCAALAACVPATAACQPRTAPPAAQDWRLLVGCYRAGDWIYGMRLRVEAASLTRNDAVATVAVSVCKDQPEPMNLCVERTRYRFVRSPGRWRLVSTEPLGRTAGECGSHLPPTPQP